MAPLSFSGGAVPGAATGPLGSGGPAADLTSASSMVSASTAFPFATDLFSFEIWVKFATCNYVSGAFMDMRDSGSDHIKVACDISGKPYFAIRDSLGNTATTTSGPTAINDNQWHQLVGVKAAASLLLYVDGVATPVGTGSTTGIVANGFLFPSSPAFTEIGYNGAGVGYQPGDYAQAAVFATVLTGADVNAHYQAALASFAGY
jgi:hypothetical protein